MSTRRSVLPVFDWGRIVRALPGLVGVVERDGRLVAVGGRLYDDDPDTLEVTHVWDLAAEPHRRRLRDALERAAEEDRATRVVVRHRHVDSAYAVEFAPDGMGQLVTVWAGLDEDLVEYDTDEVPLEEVTPEPLARAPELRTAAVPLPGPLQAALAASEPARGLPSGAAPSAAPGSLGAQAAPGGAPVVAHGAASRQPAPPPEYVIVAPLGLRRLASRLQRTLDLVTPRTAVWFDDEFDQKASRLTHQSKVLFLGPSKYADFLRRVVRPAFDKTGAAWGTTERKAMFWIHGEAEERAVRRQLDSAVNRVAQVSLSRAVRAVGSDEPPSGKELAGKLLLEPTPTRPSLDDERYLLAMSMFLLDGFEAFHRGDR